VLGTIDEDLCTRTSPVYFVPHRYRDLYWVSTPTSHPSHNLKRDDRLSAAIFESTVPPGPDLRLWALRVNRWEVHITGAHPTLGSGSDRRTPVDPAE
jgi:hypothetical protein